MQSEPVVYALLEYAAGAYVALENDYIRRAAVIRGDRRRKPRRACAYYHDLFTYRRHYPPAIAPSSRRRSS